MSGRKWGGLALGAALGTVYVGYLVFAIRAGWGPVDYETFMEIGRRWREGQAVWVGSSYYPLPMVLVFAAFSALPRWASLALWLGLPALLAVWMCGPWGLAFGPMLAHFTGGQAAGLSMAGVWGWRKAHIQGTHTQVRPYTGWMDGIILSLATLKPHLAVVPMGWALYAWWRAWRKQPVRREMGGFMVGMAVLWGLPTLIWPGWVGEWLGNLRSEQPRAMAGAIPRALAWLAPQDYFWSLVIPALAVGLIWVLERPSLERGMAVWFVAAPWVHDYDAIVLLALLAGRPGWMRWVGLASLGMWITITMFYRSDAAWWTAALPGLVYLVCVAREK